MSDVSPVVGRRGHKFENAFFSEKFDVQLFDVHLTDVNKIWQDEGD